MKSNLIFISTPYSHPDRLVMIDRFETTCQVVAKLLNQGKFPISPIVHGHPTTHYGVRGDWEFWNNYCHEFIIASHIVYVVDMEGWRESTGVQAEIKFAKEINKPVYLIDLDGQIIQEL